METIILTVFLLLNVATVIAYLPLRYVFLLQFYCGITKLTRSLLTIIFQYIKSKNL
jgi:hypothetical protein